MSEHPIRLVVSDDLQRSRLTVFFRVVLAIPHFIWLFLWTLVVVLAAVANWLATLALGRSPRPLHRFLAAYVKYVTQFYAYLQVAANPYPAFDGQDGYPVDLIIAPPARQNRWSVGFRTVLLLPAALIAAALIGDPSSGFNSGRGSFTFGFGLLHIAALLAWFSIMARKRTSRGLRDAAAYALSYGAQFWGYALLLTDRYPDSDPLAAVPSLPVNEHPIAMRVGDDLRRSRLTVFFRFPLAFPHLLWLALWGIVVLPGSLLSWLVTLFAGRTPLWLHRFLSAYLRYQIHVYAFLYVIGNPFPGFVGKAGSYPVEIAVAERRRQNRWKTGFRLILVIPALLMLSAYSSLVSVVAVLAWFSSLARARMPRGLRNAGALALRYQAQVVGYALLLTDGYPYGGPTREPGSGEQRVSQPELLPAPDSPDSPAPPHDPDAASEPARSDVPDAPDAPGAEGMPPDLGLS